MIYKTILSHCLKCRQYKPEEGECFYQTVWFVIVKKLRFIKEQQAKGLLSIVGKIPLLADLLKWS